MIPKPSGPSWLTAFALALASLAGNSSRAMDDVSRTPVFVSGTEGYHTYRIPAVIVTAKGTLLAFCEGRKTSRADDGDIDLLLRRSSDQGATWSPAQIVYEEGGDANVTIGNPCPVVDEATGRIWLPFCRNNDDILVTCSDDDGRTWAAPREITQSVKQPQWGWYATGPGVGIQLRQGRHRGRLLIPCDHRIETDASRVTSSHVFYSDDHGRTWQLGGTVSEHTNECQLVERIDGSLMINMRNCWGRDGKQPERDRMRAVALSRDGGASWVKLRFDQTLIEPICQASLCSYPAAAPRHSATLLFSNPASKTTRHRLTVRISHDGGRTWPAALLLHEGPAAYSCLTVLPDGSLGCLYEAGTASPYENIVFARFSLQSLGSNLPMPAAKPPSD